MSYNIKAVVLDNDMVPIAYANIVEIRQDGKVNQTKTDADGHFSIAVTSKSSEIKISHVGYITEQLKANDPQLSSYVELETDVTLLDPVQVNAKNSKTSNLLWWVLGLGAAGLGYYAYQKSKYKKVKA